MSFFKGSSNAALELAKKNQQAKAEEFMREYKLLVEKYGFDFIAQLHLMKINANTTNSNLSK